MLAFGVIFSVVGLIFLIAATQRDTPPPITLANGGLSGDDVTDLIQRLSPLAKDPDRPYGGLRLNFWGGGVSIELTMPNGNKFVGEARDLHTAVQRITEPSIDIKTALAGWKP